MWLPSERVRLVQYGVVGASAAGIGMFLIGSQIGLQGVVRPARAALAGDTGVGDSLPRSRPTFAAWLVLSMLGCMFVCSVAGAMLGAVLDRVAGGVPVLAVVIGCALALGFGLPITVSITVSPSLRPVRDLAAGTERVAAGDYSQRLCRLFKMMISARWRRRFNRMQAGLAERQRLQAAFGTYVDPVLATEAARTG